MTAEDVWALSGKELRALLAAGHPIAEGALDDTTYRGTSVGMPEWIDKLLWKTFGKTFHRDPETKTLRGWNIRMQQTGLYGDLKPIVKNGEPWTFGHYAVVSPEGIRKPAGCGEGLMIHYGRGGNPWWDVTNLVRDPLVAVNEGSAELLLGWSYVDLGFGCMPTPAWFTLQRHDALDHVAHP